MSILEKIVKTEAKVQSDISKANDKANKLVSDAREKGLEEALQIKIKADESIHKINEDANVESKKIDEELEKLLLNQGNDLKKSVEDKVGVIIDKMFNEAIKQ